MRGIYKNAAFVAVADTAAKGATAILALIIARFLGPTLYGEYAIAVAVCGLLLMVTDAGFERELLRRGGRDAGALPQGVMLDLAAIGLVSVVALLCYLGLLLLDLYQPRVEQLIGLMLIAMLLGRPRLIFRQVCMIWQRSGIHAAVQLVSTALLLGMTFVVLFMEGSLELIIAVQGAVAILGLWFWFRWLPSGFFAGVRVNLRKTWEFIKLSLPFGYANIVWVAYFNFDAFILSLLRSEAEVGVYAGVFRLIGINYVLGYALASTFTPVLFQKQNTKEYTEVARQLVLSTGLLGLVMAGGLFVLSPWLVNWTIGAQYAEGIPIAQVLSIAVLFRVVNFGLGEILTTQDRQGLRNKLETLLLAVNVVVNLILIPRWGGMGAAVAVVCAEVVLFGSFIVAVWQHRRQERIADAQI